MKQKFVDVSMTVKQRDLALKAINKIVAEGTGTVERLCGSASRRGAYDDLISLEGLARRLRKSQSAQATEGDDGGRHEIVGITWPQTTQANEGHGLTLDVFFAFCDDHGITVGQQLSLLALFEAAGADWGIEITERAFTEAMLRMKEASGGKIKFEIFEGFSDT